MRSDLVAARSPSPGDQPRRVGRPSLTRSASVKRARAGQEILRGNARAFQHGIFAVVANQADVQVEMAVTFASHPLLDPIADYRLVEQYALDLVQRSRAVVAMQQEGLSPQLTSYDARLAALVERLERAVHVRERERLIASRERPVDLSAYARPDAP